MIHVREILKYPHDELDRVLNMADDIVFDDGSVVKEAILEETQLSRLFWRLFEPYPEVQIKAEHHLVNVLKGKELNNQTTTRIAEAIYRTIVTEADLYRPEQKEPLLEAIYQAISDAQRWLTLVTEEDPISLDLMDMIEIEQDPVVIRLREEAYHDGRKVKYAYEESIKHIKSADHLRRNNVARLLKANLVKPAQLMQCVSFIGYLSEVDGCIFPKAVWSNYLHGNNGFYELATDSRKAVKSHLYSDSALKDSEYNARCFQLYSMVLESIRYEPCVPDKLMPWLVRGNIYDSAGTVVYSGDISRLAGKHYKTSLDNPEFKIIVGNEKELTGKTLWLRTVLSCTHEDPHCVCNECAGEIAHNVSRFDNIGHSGTVAITKELSQKVLSFKHVIASAIGMMVMLGELESMFLNAGAERDAIYVNPPKKGEKIQITIAREDAPGLGDLLKTDDIAQVALARISSVPEIGFVRTFKGGTTRTPLKTKIKDDPMMLSRDFLAYVSKQGWSVDEDNNFVFDMDKWDFSKKFLIGHNREESVADLVKQVERMVKSNQVLHKQRLTDPNAPFLLLQELFDMVNSSFHINIFCFEIVVYGLMTASPDSLALARNAENPVLGISDNLIMYRTMGAAMGYEQHASSLLSPAYYLEGNRPDSVMDVFINPDEVIRARYGEQD